MGQAACQCAGKRESTCSIGSWLPISKVARLLPPISFACTMQMESGGRRPSFLLNKENRVRTRLLIAAILVFCGNCILAEETVIKAGRLVDPDSGTVLTDQIILVHDNKIERVGKGLAIPPRAKVIDLSSMTVLPGLIDCHTHVADGHGDGDPFHVPRKTATQIRLDSVTNARQTLEYV